MSLKKIVPDFVSEIESYQNIKIVENQKDYIRYEIEGKGGKALIEVITLFPGIFLQFHSIDCKSFVIPLRGSDIGNGLKLSYCTEGRAEIRMSDNKCLFMEPYLLSLDTRTAQDIFRFPSGHYRGVELYIDEFSQEVLPSIWEECSIDIEKIKVKFSISDDEYKIISHIGRASEKIKSIFMDLIENYKEYDLIYLRIKTLELLFLLQDVYLPETCNNNTLMTIGQVEIAKKMQEIIIDDLGKNHSLKSLSEIFGVSSSSLQNYFQGVYGKSISVYTRESRMAKAADLLNQTKMTVLDIADQVGYQNASKFSAAFKRIYGESPLEYRRRSKCQTYGGN